MTVTWTMPRPELPIGVERIRRAYVNEKDMGSCRRREVVERERRVFRLEWRNAGEGGRYLINDLFEQTVGGIDDMSYTTPDGDTIRVVFTKAPEVTFGAAGVYVVKCELEEVL